jgi:hypothetical protein
MRSTLALIFLLPLCAFAAEPKPDFTVTAVEFVKESKSDRKAFTAKYSGKTVEVTGTVWMTYIPTSQVLLNGYKEKPTDSVGTPVYCNIPEKLNEQLRGLARGQQVTVRGKFPKSGSFALLDDCEFVKVGPNNAFATTLTALDAEFKKNRNVAEKKYDERSVVVRVKVLDAKTQDSKVVWTVTPSTGKATLKVQAWADPQLEKKFQQELEKIKTGDVIVLIAEAQPLGDSFRLWNSVVLKEPPAGVKLPGDKK